MRKVPSKYHSRHSFRKFMFVSVANITMRRSAAPLSYIKKDSLLVVTANVSPITRSRTLLGAAGAIFRFCFNRRMLRDIFDILGKAALVAPFTLPQTLAMISLVVFVVAASFRISARMLSTGSLRASGACVCVLNLTIWLATICIRPGQRFASYLRSKFIRRMIE